MAKSPIIAKPPARGNKPSLRGEPLTTPRMLKLIEAAEDIFLAKGYHTATMSDVAKTAGMSKKTVYQLIKSKSELFGVLLAHRQAQLAFPTPQPGWTIREVLVENLLCFGRFILSPQQIAIIRLIMAEYTHSPDLGRIFHKNRVSKGKHQLEHSLLGLTPCAAMTTAELRETSAMLFGMALGEFSLGALIGFHPMPTKAVLERRVNRAVDLFLSSCDSAECEPAPVPVKAKSKAKPRAAV